MPDCTCHAHGAEDFLRHAPGCPIYRAGLLQARDRGLTGILACAERLDALSERLGKLQLDRHQAHEVSNVRLLLHGEGFRLRKLSGDLRKPLERADQAEGAT